MDSLPKASLDNPQAAYNALLEGQHDPDGKTVFNNPQTWQELPEIITGLNRAGLQLRSAVLLDGRAPSPLLQRACETGNLPALFTEQNWQGGSVAELNRVLEAVGEAFQNQLKNQHRLRASVRQAETVRQLPSI